MHVLVAGSTGVLGRRIVPLLVGRGHQVTALTRRSDRAGMLRSLGAYPAVTDAFDPVSLAAAVKRAAPDVIMNQLTDLSAGNSAANAAVRARGTRNLMDAAHAAGVGRVISHAAGDIERGDQRVAGILGVQRGSQARIRMVPAGARAVEKPQAQHYTAPPGHGEPGGLPFCGQCGAQDARDVAHRCLLRSRPVAGIDERDGWLDIRLDVGGQSRVDQDGGGLGAQPVVLVPCLGLLQPLQRLDPRGQMEYRIHVPRGRGHRERVE
jgi:hypothetical protein